MKVENGEGVSACRSIVIVMRPSSRPLEPLDGANLVILHFYAKRSTQRHFA